MQIALRLVTCALQDIKEALAAVGFTMKLAEQAFLGPLMRAAPGTCHHLFIQKRTDYITRRQHGRLCQPPCLSPRLKCLHLMDSLLAQRMHLGVPCEAA